MNINEVIKGLVQEEIYNDGIKCLKLFQVDNVDEIRREVSNIVKTKPASVIGDITNMSDHYLDIDHIVPNHNKIPEMVTGAWRTYRIIREQPGWMEDTAYIDYKADYRNFKFHFANEYPAIASFIKKFPYAIVGNISGLLPKTKLLPHSESMRINWKDKPSILMRFHLPLIVNEGSYFWFQGKSYFLEPGWVYLFNGATVHSAVNNSDMSRYVLILDCLASHALNQVFEDAVAPPLLRNEEMYIDPNHIFNKNIPTDLESTIEKIHVWDDPFNV